MPLCTYCKDTGDTLDHVVPVSFADVVPCCGDCNNLLGNVFLHTVGSRVGFLAEKYKKRFKKLLKSPDWSEEELLELGESLSKTLRQANILKKEIEIRIKNCELVRDLNPSIEEVWKEIEGNL